RERSPCSFADTRAGVPTPTRTCTSSAPRGSSSSSPLPSATSARGLAQRRARSSACGRTTERCLPSRGSYWCTGIRACSGRRGEKRQTSRSCPAARNRNGRKQVELSRVLAGGCVVIGRPASLCRQAQPLVLLQVCDDLE